MRPRVGAEKALSQGPLGEKGAVWTPRLRFFKQASGIGVPSYFKMTILRRVDISSVWS